MPDVTLTIDGDSVSVPAGTTILKAAETARPACSDHLLSRLLHRQRPLPHLRGRSRRRKAARAGVLEPGERRHESLHARARAPSAAGAPSWRCSPPPWIFLRRRRSRSSSTIIAPTASAFPKPSGARCRCSMIIRCTSATIPSASCAGAAFRYAPTMRSLPMRSTSEGAASIPGSAPFLTSPCRKPPAYFAASASASAPPAR